MEGTWHAHANRYASANLRDEESADEIAQKTEFGGAEALY